MDRHRALSLFQLACAAAVAALTLICAAAAAPAARSATITVRAGQTNGGSAPERQFNAAAITIAAGDTVRWEWFADEHDVTAYDGSWSSPLLNGAGQSYSRTFSVTGTYTYYCDRHAGPSDARPDRVDGSIVDGKMVGKITVAAAASDTTPPTASAVAASPNPTNGATSVALTATITDAGTPLGTIASAQYRVDGGAATAMSSVDGTFNGSSENVTASVPVGALSLGSHTIEVRGTDAAGNVGAWVALSGGLEVSAAGSTTATVNVTPGALTNTAYDIVFPAVPLNGSDQTVPGLRTVWQATDARGTGSGWNVTISSTNFTGSGVIPVANFKVKQDQSEVVTVAGNAAPTSSVTSFQSLSGTPLRILQATGGTGMGTYTYAPAFQLTVPGSSGIGSYTATVTVAINSGP